MSYNEKIISLIGKNLKDGVLTEDFSLADLNGEDTGAVRWADGAKDGVLMYHMAPPVIPEEQAQLVDEALDSLDDSEKALELMDKFLEKVSPIRGIDVIQRKICAKASVIDGKKLFELGLGCLFSNEIDRVKLGLMVIEMFGEPTVQLKCIIRILGQCDEFTIFVIFNMLTWENANIELFGLARQVRGWGRIHAVSRLEPGSEEMREWLLFEGINNTVMSQYSALTVYAKAGIRELLAGGPTAEELDAAARVVLSMFDEGPVAGISALPAEEEAELCAGFIKQAEKHGLSEDVRSLLKLFSESERSAEYAECCTALLNG